MGLFSNLVNRALIVSRALRIRSPCEGALVGALVGALGWVGVFGACLGVFGALGCLNVGMMGTCFSISKAVVSLLSSSALNP